MTLLTGHPQLSMGEFVQMAGSVAATAIGAGKIAKKVGSAGKEGVRKTAQSAVNAHGSISKMASAGKTASNAVKELRFIAPLLSLVKKPICPDCKRASKFSGGNGGYEAGGSSKYADKAAAKIAEENAARERLKEQQAAHKAAIQEIKNYTFDDSSDEAFTRSLMNFIDDYMECNPGLFADGDYKKAYKRRIESELKMQKTSNPERAEKIKSLYEEAVETMKKRLKTRFIISGVIVIVVIIAGIIFAVSAGESVGTGIGIAAIFALIFCWIPHIVGKNKENNEYI